ncbi:MAG: nucleotidyltransferase domain-containing protein [Draconibacterium sp.]
MVNNNAESLSIIREITHRFLPESKVLLFGSRARNDYNPESDYDFLVITSKPIEIRERRILKSMIRKELARFKIPADILIQSEEEVNSKKEITGHILKQVIKEGVVL